MTRDNNNNEPEPMSLPALKIDWDYYGQMLEDSDLSDAEKVEFINTIWSIVGAFVDLGFGLHPVQQSCGQDSQGPFIDPSELICLTQTNSEFLRASAPEPEEEGSWRCRQ